MDREIFLKRYLKGFSIDEIAQELGYSKDYTRSRKKMNRIVGDIK